MLRPSQNYATSPTHSIEIGNSDNFSEELGRQGDRSHPMLKPVQKEQETEIAWIHQLNELSRRGRGALPSGSQAATAFRQSIPDSSNGLLRSSSD